MNTDKKFICILCDKECFGYGNNAMPLANGRCCNRCNGKVILARLNQMQKHKEIKVKPEDTKPMKFKGTKFDTDKKYHTGTFEQQDEREMNESKRKHVE